MYEENEINKRYWEEYTKIASEEYEKKMKELPDADDNRLRGSVHGTAAPNHLMYKTGSVSCNDGREYEFLIEYDINDPVAGIYYGVKGLTPDEMNHSDAITKFKEEFDELKYEMCTILNNTFPNKDFSHRFKKTNNANDKTFWPFWISLYDDEDINNVGLRALIIIKHIYERKIIRHENFVKKKPKEKKLEAEITAFTNDAYEKLLHRLGKNKFEFEKFLEFLEKHDIIIKDGNYEKAWRLVEHFSNIDIARLMKLFFQKFKITITWKTFVNIILSPEGTVFNPENLYSEIKNQSCDKKKAEEKRWTGVINQYVNES